MTTDGTRDATRIAGGCLCGAVRYASEAEPVVMAVCHCPHCQKQTSSAFSMIVGIPSGTLRFQGRPTAAFEDEGESGQPVTRRFCPRCGSAIVTHVSAAPELEWIKAGTLDDPSWFEPQMHIWCESAQPWLSIDDSLPRFEKTPRWAANPPEQRSVFDPTGKIQQMDALPAPEQQRAPD